jgi:D-amino-acid dehydrogenase
LRTSVKILLVAPQPAAGRAPKFGANVDYAPQLLSATGDELGNALVQARADVLIHPGPVDTETLRMWRDARGDAVLLVLSGVPANDGDLWRRLRIRQHNLPADSGRYEAVLMLGERLWNDEQVRSVVLPLGRRTRQVTLVGAGAVNLITALRLAQAGNEITVIDAAPDPRADADWTRYGCTHGGGDGRMFTLTEADSYNSRARNQSGAPNDLLWRGISDHGWRVTPAGAADAGERQWADDFHNMPAWLAESYNADIFRISQRAATLWEELIKTTPALFDKHTGYRDGILRLYNDAEYFAWHVARNDMVGATRRLLTREEVAEDYPALADACAGGAVAAGLEVIGFTVNIHRFVAELIRLLERLGVEFQWNRRVRGIRWSRPGVAVGLDTDEGLLTGTHLVVSPGAYGRDLLRGTAAQDEIQGMLGAWLTVPNVEPVLGHSLKIARKGHRAEESNVTLGDDGAGTATLICGSGYGWTGRNPGNIDAAELESLFDAVADTLRNYFPRAYESALATGTLISSRRYCVRPWTASCLGIFEQVPTTTGHSLLVTGGHNTGGFAQSPAIAEAVGAAIDGRDHEMHRHYAPGRLARFYRSS